MNHAKRDKVIHHRAPRDVETTGVSTYGVRDSCFDSAQHEVVADENLLTSL
ncbi:MAG: hypothetical protein OEV49_07915 [candidate division Zixibacteria bacterium]|nr:hypothetical protein [candidate division Zixibacteria bacterium]MDH3936274.1 hypothetical protein [candidate division Zixibacteria bacterium]MDH4033649.1 hypothetical protein [candidate division Zixibacteria bacterium]